MYISVFFSQNSFLSDIDVPGGLEDSNVLDGSDVFNVRYIHAASLEFFAGSVIYLVG